MNRSWINQQNIRRVGLIAAPVIALISYFVLPDSYLNAAGETVLFPHKGRVTTALGLWMAIWWITEAIPVYATALLPLAILPAAGASSMSEAAAPYGHELIFLFMGGFILALSMQRWGLHERIALAGLRLAGTKPQNIVGAFIAVCGFLSMWVSNTATAMMMLPIALSVIHVVLKQTTGEGLDEVNQFSSKEGHNFALCLMLGIAYASSIGGIGTLIGTPPNLFLASFARNQLRMDISFVRWMGIGLPLVVIFLPIVWLLLTKFLYPIRIGEMRGGREFIDIAYRRLGSFKTPEKITLVVFVCTALLWITRPLLSRIDFSGFRPFSGLTDTGIAMIAALSLFMIPAGRKNSGFVMDWETAVKLPWGLLILFGGGLSLAAAVQANGVAELLGSRVAAFRGLPPVLIVVFVTTLMIFLTELSSNTASTATLVPILSAIAPGLGIDPLLLIIPAAIAASCAFMLPVATPPNAIVFGSNYVTIPQMARAGLWLNLIGIVLISILVYTVVKPLLAIS